MVFATMAAGGDTAQNDGGAEQAVEGAFDPGSHDRVLSKGLLIPCNGAGATLCAVIAARFRFVSLFFSA
jgi:hypothetical protein